MDTEEFIGLTIVEAEKLAYNNDVDLRILVQTETYSLHHPDFRCDLVNLEVQKGKIIQASVGKLQ